MNCEISVVQAEFRKTEKPYIKLPTSVGSLKKQDISRKTSTSTLLTMPEPLTEGTQQIVENSETDGNTRPPYLPHEKWYADQEAPVRTRYGTKDWFQIKKGVCQGCILNPA